MGASIPNPGGGGKRSLDAEINLVPFIDLLCSLISFLLMTAVWMQISSLELKQGSDNSEQTEQKEPQAQLKVHIHERGFTIVPPESPEVAISCTSDVCSKSNDQVGEDGKPTTVLQSYYDYGQLALKLEQEKEKLPNQRSVSIVLGDGIPYNDMIKTMDTCLGVGLDGISLSGTML